MSVDTSITLKDALNNDIVMRVRQFDDGKLAFYHVFDDRLPPGTDRSGTIAAANTSQQVAAANANRVKMGIQNTSDTMMYVSEDGNPATISSYKLPQAVTAYMDTNNQVNIFCTVTGKSFTSTEMIRL